MSEKLLRFLLPELVTVVIRCTQPGTQKPCTGAIEMSADDLRKLNKPLFCPVCGTAFANKSTGPRSQNNSLVELGIALDAVKTQADRDHFQVEFVVPDPAK
jgi:hypothetical protein